MNVASAETVVEDGKLYFYYNEQPGLGGIDLFRITCQRHDDDNLRFFQTMRYTIVQCLAIAGSNADNVIHVVDHSLPG